MREWAVIRNSVCNCAFGFRPSKQITLHEIRDPFNLPDETPSFKDYTGSRNQRFSTPESAARNRIVRPTNVLHWFNAPATMTEERVKQVCGLINRTYSQ